MLSHAAPYQPGVAKLLQTVMEGSELLMSELKNAKERFNAAIECVHAAFGLNFSV